MYTNVLLHCSSVSQRTEFLLTCLPEELSQHRGVVLQVANIRQGMDVGLLLTGVPLVVLSRAVNIYPLAYLVNKGEPLRVT